jgi:3-deoxy-manno-octulosonate cytidylyltransferase (CMP-KDO synthetase)
VIATDSREIARRVEAFGGEAVMTGAKHRTGTDRIAEAARSVSSDIVVNIQADNFGLTGSVLDRVVTRMKRARSIRFATLASRVTNDDDLFNPDVVKVIMNAGKRALWFSRYPLPYLRGARDEGRFSQYAYHQHIGVYFFRRAALSQFARWRPSPLERAESLEQLRVHEHGEPMTVYTTRSRIVSVDSPADVGNLEHVYK